MNSKQKKALANAERTLKAINWDKFWANVRERLNKLRKNQHSPWS